MNNNRSFDKQIYYRLIALWAVCEAFLGGIIHGLKIPVSGLIVGSGAALCICMIAYYVPIKGAILKATVMVVICKMMLSPQSPPLAYAAVLFQGLMGEILFFNKKNFKTSCLLFCVITLFESGVQHILIMTIIYGKNFWVVVNDFINHLMRYQSTTNYSIVLISGYILLHIIIGIAIGLWIGRIVKLSEQWNLLHKGDIITIPVEDMKMNIFFPTSPKRKRYGIGLFIIWIILIISFMQSWFHIGSPLLPSQKVLQILFRSFLIILSWYFLISPLVILLLKKYLSAQQKKVQDDLTEVLLLLPSTKYIIQQSWQLSNKSRGWKRLMQCGKIVLMNTLQKNNDH